MKIKSTMISNKSTDGGNHSTEGSNESTRNEPDQDAKFARMSSKGLPKETYGTGPMEYTEVKKPGIDRITGGGSVNSDAAREVECKHPSREYDPACRC